MSGLPPFCIGGLYFVSVFAHASTSSRRCFDCAQKHIASAVSFRGYVGGFFFSVDDSKCSI